MPNHFAANFKTLRKRSGKTQAEVAAELMISRPALGSYEEGRADPGLERLITIAAYFELTIDKLLKEVIE